MNQKENPVANLTDDLILTTLAEHGMTGTDATTALAAWRQAGADHPDAARVDAVLRSAGLVGAR